LAPLPPPSTYGEAENLEELIVDFALNAQPTGIPTQPIVINQRVILNYYTAKRLAITLGQLIRRYEDQFGELKLNVSERVAPKS